MNENTEDMDMERSEFGDEAVAAAEPPVDEVDLDSDEARGRGEGVGQAKEIEGLSQNQIVARRFFRHKGAMLGLITLALVALLAFSSMGFGAIPGWWQFQDHTEVMSLELDRGAPTMSLPTWLGGDGFAIGNHPFGQDNVGKDNFALVMKGVQTSLLVVFTIAIMASIIGITVGSLAGYYRGVVDTILMRLTDLVITLPLIVLGSVLGVLISTLPDKFNMSNEQKAFIGDNMPIFLGLLLGLVMWPGLARLVRSEFLRLRELEFVDSARVAGASDRRIILKHMLPNAVGVAIVNITLLMAAAVVLEAALSFLGFGIKQPNVSLGLLVSQYQTAFATRPWLFWWPGLFIVLIALSINMIGDGLRDAFDPRTKRVPSKRKMRRAEKLAVAAETNPANERQSVSAGNVLETNAELETPGGEERQ